MRLRYTRRGWFLVWIVAVGTVDFHTGVTLPDRDGFFWRRWLLGPFSTAKEAYRVWPY